MARYLTGAQCVIDVMKSMGLPAPVSVSDSQDPTALQMWQLATEAGQQLLTAAPWQILSRDMTITTVPGQTTYPLPSDWNRFIADAQWNQTTRLPALGSLQEWEWQMLKARNLAGTTFTMLFRIDGDAVVFFESPNEIQTIVMPYQSRGWVRQPSPLLVKDTLDENSDIVLYDSQLFKTKLKLDWLAEKKFDTTRQQRIYDDMLRDIAGADVPSRTLSIVGGYGFPYLNNINVPDTRFGS